MEPENESVLAGRVIKLKKRSLKSGSNMFIGEILSQGDVSSFYFESASEAVKLGSYVVLRGFRKNIEDNRTFVSSEIEFQATPKSLNGKLPNHLLRGMDARAMGLLVIRSLVESEIHSVLRKEGFIPVSSPALVSNWTAGQTGSFRASFYETENCSLTISNLIYHQMSMVNGMTRIYEVSKLFRKENPSNRKRLAEFTIVDISLANVKLETLIAVFNQLLSAIHTLLLNLPIRNPALPPIPAELRFDRIDFRELLARAGLAELSGHQLPSQVSHYLDENFTSFVWVTGFPEHTRPFYQRSTPDRYCNDAQLWYQGKIYVGAGGECETDAKRVIEKIKAEGKNHEAFDFYTQALEFGMPEISGISLGIERVLAAWLGGGTTAADFAYYPRYQSNFIP
jgi:aspartyl/asparaginyl-tRNA synthetase